MIPRVSLEEEDSHIFLENLACNKIKVMFSFKVIFKMIQYVPDRESVTGCPKKRDIKFPKIPVIYITV